MLLLFLFALFSFSDSDGKSKLTWPIVGITLGTGFSLLIFAIVFTICCFREKPVDNRVVYIDGPISPIAEKADNN
ncbi:hypothetical protein TVAG_228650 [Trichomonas vaginalis G3]|uniref:Uncharacterized protein n=1 Tax=Trichomonas vaginalis (strain ATCC PRA-98 / G3) TaxID=412133 RepID=A2DJ27_TRIV3|nr:hypothetical protein TVAGG3_0470770 [Trichomonas vaginalis G3]EAY19602.1 hypothetical protein TVAG_228650 [Trichomonas vaginalis G3]KAI5515042.1 hypothetical protein TVAGG3_0470770 [Trichomonas vaginalis G3]|eukprot:XP_001580588.1 hypothetical protein [Trichomonas vaginalis G3]